MSRRMPLLLVSLLLGACAPRTPATPPQPAEVRARVVVLMLDGVPHALMDSLWGTGHFAGFSRPSAVVSPFPSLTGVAFGEVWHEQPPGYEDRWFDPVGNRIRGGLIEHVVHSEAEEGYRDRIDIRSDGLSATLAYVAPGRLAARELRALRTRLLQQIATDTVVLAYVVATDALAHRAGRDEVVRALLEVERVVAEVKQAAPGARMILFSDHGSDFMPSRRVDIEGALRADGFDPARRLEEANDVVVPRFGLVSSAFVHAFPEAEARIAETLAAVPGVDLAFHEDDRGVIHVRAARGRATIETSLDGRLRYTALEGDPLGLAGAAERFRRQDAQGLASDSAWFAASLETPYWDSLRRITAAVRSGVRHPASVAVSFESGWHYGAPAADFFVDVTGTHGSLLTASSLAFFMTDGEPVPPLLRSRDLLQWLPTH